MNAKAPDEMSNLLEPNYWWQILDVAPLACVVVSREDQPFFANRAANELFEVQSESAIQANFSNLLAEQYRLEYLGALQCCLAKFGETLAMCASEEQLTCESVDGQPLNIRLVAFGSDIANAALALFIGVG